MGSAFFDRYGEVDARVHWLPHWHQGGCLTLFTWRLKDSLPQKLLREWNRERIQWEKFHPKPWSLELEDEVYERFEAREEAVLNEGRGACVLRDPEVAGYLESVIQQFDGIRFQLDSYVIMPNHVHVLAALNEDTPQGKTVGAWKSKSASQINQHLNRSGPLWLPDYWDRLIRSYRHYLYVRNYIADNPLKAGLKQGYVLYQKPLEDFE